MKILHLATFLQGGAGRIIAGLAADQRRAGHDVLVVASRTGAPGYGNYQSYLDELEAARVPVRLVDSLFARDHAANLAVVRALDHLIARGAEPDVIHAHAAIPSLAALVFAGARRRPMALIQTMHGWGLTKTAPQRDTDIALLNLVDRVIVPSRHSSDLLASLGVARARLSVVPYGVGETGAALDARDQIALDDMDQARRAGALVVVCVGTVGARKNQRLLVEALTRLPHVPIHAVFIGDGDAAALHLLIEAAGLDNRVRLHGYSRAARRLAAHADLLVLPSRSEGQPLAILEAFCDATLVAASRIPELSELVQDGVTGFLFDSEDAGSLATALERLSQMPGPERREITGRARAVYASRFSISAMAQNYHDVYRGLLGVATEPVAKLAVTSAA